ncbi:MAG: ROK family protein [bacterium]
MPTLPALDVGGTHVTGALVDTDSWTLTGHSARRSLDSSGSADAILAEFCAAVDALATPGRPLGVAMPDPFDYERGIALFADVGKFDRLHGVDVRVGIIDGVRARPSSVAFVNDADAFTLGEWIAGSARGTERCVGITLGTGIGSGFLVSGRPARGPGLPRNGRVHTLRLGDVPLEDMVSRRAIRRQYAFHGGDRNADVRDIAHRARDGEAVAAAVLDRVMRDLAATLADVLRSFAPEIIVVGGSMSASWDLFEPSFRSGLRDAGGSDEVAIVAVRDTERAALIGAAFFAADAYPAAR